MRETDLEIWTLTVENGVKLRSAVGPKGVVIGTYSYRGSAATAILSIRIIV